MGTRTTVALVCLVGWHMVSGRLDADESLGRQYRARQQAVVDRDASQRLVPTITTQRAADARCHRYGRQE
jgi:hypothetical protein